MLQVFLIVADISNTSKLDAFINSIGGTSLSIGSVKVNTINLRRISIESNGNKDEYINILNDRVDLCIKTLDVKSIIKRNIEKGTIAQLYLWTNWN